MLKFEIEDQEWGPVITAIIKICPELEDRLNGYYDIASTKDAKRIKGIYDAVYDKALLEIEGYEKRYGKVKDDLDSGRISYETFVAGCYGIYVDVLILLAEIGFADTVIGEQEMTKVLSSCAGLLAGHGYDIPTFLKAIEPRTKPSLYMRKITEYRRWWESVQRDADIYDLLEENEKRALAQPRYQELVARIRGYGDDVVNEFEKLMKEGNTDMFLLNYETQERTDSKDDLDCLLGNPEIKNIFEIYSNAKEAQDEYHILIRELLAPVQFKVKNVVIDFLVSKRVIPAGQIIVGYLLVEKYREYIGNGYPCKKDRR